MDTALWEKTAGTWTALEGKTAKVEEVGGMSVMARKEGGATVCRLRGRMKVKAGSELSEADTFATLPAGFRPEATVNLQLPALVSGIFILSIASTGVMKTLGTPLKEGNTFTLDGVTFNLT